ncbi:MAG: CDGSH iron-sulfur domain-containing protein [Actinomycetes bacterium]
MSTVKISARENGPYLVKGEVDLCDAEGNVVRTETKMALCRCGHSANKPFCDGSHRTQGFIAPAIS